MTSDDQIGLHVRQRLACCHPQLPLDQIQPGDHLGHWMLHLQTGVHLHKVEGTAGVNDELHRAGAHVAHSARRRDGGFTHGLTAGCIHAGGGGFFNHLLVAPLHRTVALEEVHHVAVCVSEDLNLDMPRFACIALEQHRVVAEGRDCLTPA